MLNRKLIVAALFAAFALPSLALAQDAPKAPEPAKAPEPPKAPYTLSANVYLVSDYFHVTGGWVVGDAQGNGNHFGAGEPYKNETELAVGARFKF